MMRGLDLIGADKEAVVAKLRTSIFISGVVAAAALAYLWRSHRVIGGLLGFFIVGPVVGIGITSATLTQDDRKAIRSA